MNRSEFWDILSEKYPEEVGDFTHWCDEFKRRYNWFGIFREGADTIETPLGTAVIHKSIKIHDLPQAMQIGIFLQYTIEHGGPVLFCGITMESTIRSIKVWFEAEHHSVNNSK